jgi:D-beta-D-heptose 7-phosphate kinase / D-beta-D-heptose 1-phosphate adenosyltransferase
MFHDLSGVRNHVAQGFSAARVLVIGDMMLDCHVRGEVSRISPEAPVPVVRTTGRTWSAGGAANVAANLSGLGVQVSVAGFTGQDDGRTRLIEQLKHINVGTDFLVPLTDRATIIKTRIIGGHQQMLRIDDEDTSTIKAEQRAQLISAITQAIAARPTAIVLSDYAKGVCDPDICQAVIAQARAAGIPVLVDPKGVNWDKYHGATTITPNTGELAAVTRVSSHDYAALVGEGHKLRERLGLAFMTFTRGEHGISLLDNSGEFTVPAAAREVFDVSGAGDTVIAVMAACLALGETGEKGEQRIARRDAVRLANIAGGVVVGKVGTVPITRAELLTRLDNDPSLAHVGKVCTWAEAKQRVQQWQERGDAMVFTNGCFDLLHAGHVMLLEQSRRAGDKLIVGLNSDASVKRLKGPTRPINSEDDRAQVLAALAAVDMVVIFDEDTPLELINHLRPNILVKGADYREDQVVGGAEVKSWGGRVVLIDLLAGRSTTSMINKAK